MTDTQPANGYNAAGERVVRKSAWHYRIQAFTFGKPLFAHWCPYWHMVYISFILAPFAAVVRGVWALLVRVATWHDARSARRAQKAKVAANARLQKQFTHMVVHYGPSAMEDVEFIVKLEAWFRAKAALLSGDDLERWEVGLTLEDTVFHKLYNSSRPFVRCSRSMWNILSEEQVDALYASVGGAHRVAAEGEINYRDRCQVLSDQATATLANASWNNKRKRYEVATPRIPRCDTKAKAKPQSASSKARLSGVVTKMQAWVHKHRTLLLAIGKSVSIAAGTILAAIAVALACVAIYKWVQVVTLAGTLRVLKVVGIVLAIMVAVALLGALVGFLTERLKECIDSPKGPVRKAFNIVGWLFLGITLPLWGPVLLLLCLWGKVGPTVKRWWAAFKDVAGAFKGQVCPAIDFVDDDYEEDTEEDTDLEEEPVTA